MVAVTTFEHAKDVLKGIAVASTTDAAPADPTPTPRGDSEPIESTLLSVPNTHPAIGNTDTKEAERKAHKRAYSRRWMAQKRRAQGVVMPRAEWLRAHARRPWDGSGLSKSSFYRNRARKGVLRVA
jgi:hypothetical protein